jgi:hypothetical protein
LGVAGLTSCTPDIGDVPKVINGASDLFVELFRKTGRHVRTALG